jgi:hypothetical protein
MLLRVALVASAFSAFILAAEPPAAPVFSGKLFPNQGKSLTQLTRQALDEQIAAALAAKQTKGETVNPGRMLGPRVFRLQGKRNPLRGQWQIARAFPAITNQRTACAIPLLDAKTAPAKDAMRIPAGKSTLDRMSKSTPVPACKNWN